MTARSITDRVIDMNVEIERFAAFDHPTRRFIAHAISLVPELRPLINTNRVHADNSPAPFVVGEAESAERAAAYAALPTLRACTATGLAGQRERRLEFGALLEPARVDLRWKRLTSLPAFLFCYERIAGPAWRELLPLAWKEAALERRRRVKRGAQLPLDPRLFDDASVPDLLRDEPAPWYFPSLADADLINPAPLLSGL